MFKIQQSTLYALRALSYMYKKDKKIVTAVEISENVGIPYLYLMKILSLLRKNKIICSIQGCNGGYRPVKDFKKVSAYDICQCTEGDLEIEDISEEDVDHDSEMVQNMFIDIKKASVAYLKSITLEMLFDGKLYSKSLKNGEIVSLKYSEAKEKSLKAAN